ncbi:MAG: hypothetical protein RBU29_05155, partial [bacterium]|nr:hypothetical protein [bacterium]
MKKLFVLGFALCMLLPQAFGVVLFSSNGEDISNFTLLSGEWSTEQGMIERVGVQEGGKTHGIVLDNVIDMTTVTFPVVLTYDVKVEKDAEGAGEVWTGIGIGAPAPGASNPEDGAIIVALRDNGGSKGLNFLVGGRQWAQGNANFDWQADTWYTMRVALSNPNFGTNQVDITASIVEKGTDVGVVISGQGVPTGGNPYVLTQKALAIFSRGSAEGKGGIRSFDNIVLEAANVAGGAIAYQNDGTSVAEFTQVKGVFEVVDGAIVRTDAVAPDTTQGAMIGGVASMEGNASVSLEYDIKVETITTAGDETWSGIALFTPAPTASNIEDGAVIMTMRDGGLGSDQGRGVHALRGGR